MQTRSFSAFDTYSLLVPGSVCRNIGLTVRNLRAVSRTAADRWLQLHSGVAVPANGAVPVVAATTVPNAYIGTDDFNDGLLVPGPGLVAVISSTAKTLTADATATVDITVVVDEF